jgi:toxin ParE1/3/4
MARLIWTEPALLVLDEIAEYIALDNVAAAKKLVQTIFKKTERLELHPLSGRNPPELKPSNYREIIVGPCRVFYRIVADDIYIIYIMRSEHQLRTYLLDERKTSMNHGKNQEEF